MLKKIKKITIIKPDDWHVHLRDKETLKKVIQYTEKYYKRAIIMPNLENPVTNCTKSIAYQKRILNARKLDSNFEPLMVCYLTKNTSLKDLQIGFSKKIFIGAKLYPYGATTNSLEGIKNINEIYHILELMEKIKMPLLIHGEKIDNNIDIYDREKKFIDDTLILIRKKFPELKITLEHITTKEAVSYVEEHNSLYLSATITPHHLMCNRNDMFIKGIQPNLYCLPVLKRNIHQIALKKAISNGKKNFFLGSDTAPHFYQKKISNGCAGIFNAPVSLLCYITIFEEMNALKNFQSFCSENGPNFYNIPINQETITLVKKPYKNLNQINIGNNKIIPFLAGKTLNWSLETNEESFKKEK
ncbi:dihydroorotase [Buchnera aphidicola (Melanaphis sacchari)]|uniref:Dihydroorotase n=1 Tax=Buchnera aphidicola (Melanaphis sacchari) TaxID=2173854 RepID=A0A2U8DF62_9GAMM|nr:dihydroorotase [Buchnera aphidicola]AWH90460.1 dihydroorotase [Buchnera aphidicola (Melanaphis sacchari)]